MEEKVYCTQCHRSVIMKTNRLPAGHCLRLNIAKCNCIYCFKLKLYKDIDSRINDCRYFLPESREKLMSGKWKPNSIGR